MTHELEPGWRVGKKQTAIKTVGALLLGGAAMQATLLPTGSLKLKQRNTDGFFCWRAVHLQFDQHRDALLCTTEQSSTEVIGLGNAECSISQSSVLVLRGCGFDLTFPNCKTLNFLASDPASCNAWVSCLTSAIATISSDVPADADRQVGSAQSIAAAAAAAVVDEQQFDWQKQRHQSPTLSTIERNISLNTGDASHSCSTPVTASMSLLYERPAERQQSVHAPSSEHHDSQLNATQLYKHNDQQRRERDSTFAVASEQQSVADSVTTPRSQLQQHAGYQYDSLHKSRTYDAEPPVSKVDANHIETQAVESQYKAALTAAQQRIDELECTVRAASSKHTTEAFLEAQGDSLQQDKRALQEQLHSVMLGATDDRRQLAAELQQRHESDITAVVAKYELQLQAPQSRSDSMQFDESAANARIHTEQLVKQHTVAIQKLRNELEQQYSAKLAQMENERHSERQAIQSDLQQLQNMHKQRVQQLELQLLEEGESLKSSKREVEVLRTARAADAREFKQWRDTERKASQSQLYELEAIQSAVKAAIKREESARHKETLAYDELQKVMEQLRLERAETAEIKRQLNAYVAESKQDANEYKAYAKRVKQLEQALHASTQEIAILEAQLRRNTAERTGLEANLDRLNRLVYGVHSRKALADDNTNINNSLTADTAVQNAKHAVNTSNTTSLRSATVANGIAFTPRKARASHHQTSSATISRDRKHSSSTLQQHTLSATQRPTLAHIDRRAYSISHSNGVVLSSNSIKSRFNTPVKAVVARSRSATPMSTTVDRKHAWNVSSNR
jgi:hypothetical protein